MARLRPEEGLVLRLAEERPKDFLLDAYVAQRHFNYGDGRLVRLVLEFKEPRLKKFLEETPLVAGQVMKTLEDGFTRVEARVDDSRLIDAWAASWGCDVFRVLERRAVRRLSKSKEARPLSRTN